MEIKTKLEQGKFYHIYNKGVDSCDIFRETANYEHFLRLYDKYIVPIASTFAWVLMKNHFHLLVRIDTPTNLTNLEGFQKPSKFNQQTNEVPQTFKVSKNLEGLNKTNEVPTNLEGLQDLQGLNKVPHQQFSNFFNAYTKAFNKRYQRKGSLFEHTFKRKEVDNENYLKTVLLYIHNNPVHHGFCQQPWDYPWSSYLSCLSIKPTKLQRDTVIGWFDNEANFKQVHNDKLDIENIESFLEM